MIAANGPSRNAATQRLLFVDEYGNVTHRSRCEFPKLLGAGDLVIANDAATLPASLFGIHVRTGGAVELRLAGRDSLRPEHVERFVAVVFGAGDFRIPTEHRPAPPPVSPGDVLQLGPLRASVLRVLAHPRVVEVRFQNSVPEIWEGLARYARPIQYSYVLEPLEVWDTWTRIASQPVAFEPPSATFALDWTMIRLLRSRGVRFATLTHAAGISSTGDPELDRLLPFDEPYCVPSSTAAAIDMARRNGGRVIAIGTTVVRALEHAAQPDGSVRPGEGIATQRIGPWSPLRIVDAIVSGTHERSSSHYELLGAFQDDEALHRMDREAEACGYRTHEFGDSVFLLRASPSRAKSRCESPIQLIA